MPNVSDMDKDALAAVIKQLYDQSCSVFAEKAEYHNKNNQNINPPPFHRLKSPEPGDGSEKDCNFRWLTD